MSGTRNIFFLSCVLFLMFSPVAVLGQVGGGQFGDGDPSSSTSKTNFSGVVGSGARAFGMGGAFIAVADDATAASWNPGGLGQLERPELTMVFRYQGFREMNPAASYSDYFKGAIELKGSTEDFDFFSFTYPFRIGSVKLVPQLSYQRAISFDLTSTMNDVRAEFVRTRPNSNSQELFQGVFSDKQDFQGGLDTLTVSLGTQLFNRLNIGVSVNIWRNGFSGETTREFKGTATSVAFPDQSQSAGFTNSDIIEMEIKGVNYNIGVLLDIVRNLKLGLVYKSSFNADVNYSLTTQRGSSNKVGDMEPQPSGPQDFTLNWPETYGAGLSYRPIDRLTFSMDFTYTRWSQSIIKDFTLLPVFNDDSIPGQGEGVTVDVTFPSLQAVKGEYAKEQNDTGQFRLGMEYVLFGKNVLIPLRLGFFTDSQFYSDVSSQLITFYGLTSGFGVKWKGFTLDLAVMYEFGSYLKSLDDYTDTRFSEIKGFVSASYSF